MCSPHYASPPDRRLTSMSGDRTDQERRLEVVFANLEANFKRLDKARDAAKTQALLKDVTAQLKDAKA